MNNSGPAYSPLPIYYASSPTPPPVVPSTTPTYILSASTTTNPNPSPPSQPIVDDEEARYIGPERRYTAVDCIFGRWLMWDGFVSGILMFAPSPHSTSNCLCCYWLLYVFLFPISLLAAILFGFVGLIIDIVRTLLWVITFGFCCTRCDTRCKRKRVPPKKWYTCCPH